MQKFIGGVGLFLLFILPIAAAPGYGAGTSNRSSGIVAYSELDGAAARPTPSRPAYPSNSSHTQVAPLRAKRPQFIATADYKNPPNYLQPAPVVPPHARVAIPSPVVSPPPAVAVIRPAPQVAAIVPAPAPIAQPQANVRSIPPAYNTTAPAALNPAPTQLPPASANGYATPSSSPRPVAARTPPPRASEPEPDRFGSIWVNGGVSSSSLVWNIGVPPTVDILSELTWRNVRSTRVGAGGEYVCNNGWCENIMLNASLYGDGSYSGSNQDSDYFTNGRTNEFSRSVNDIDGSTLRGFSAGLGYWAAMDLGDVTLSLIPSIGYSYDTQDMRTNNGNQVVPNNGPFPGLDSKYSAEWHGPFANLQARIRLLEKHELRAGFGIHKSEYQGEATWNLRSDFAQPTSFEQFANGFGRKLELGYSYWLTPDWEIKLDARYEQYKAGPGIDIVYFSDDTTGTTRFNEVKYKSHSYTAGLAYNF